MATFATQAIRSEDRMPIEVFVVSQNLRLRESLQEKLGLPRWKVMPAAGGAEALRILRDHGVDDGVLLLDPSLPDLEPGEFQGMVRDRHPNTQILMLNSHTGQLLLGSASPTSISRRLVDAVNKTATITAGPQAVAAIEQARVPSSRGVRLRSMIGDSEQMMRAYALTRMVAPRDTTVLVLGESGTGKDLVAQELHLISPRRNQPLVVVNCAAIPDTLLEAELFGYAKGAFTGALQSRIGRIQAAHGGTLFLDEIGDMPLALQSKILRFLEQGEVQRIGGNDNLRVDVRVIAATNADLKKRVARHEFREDLYHRLAIFPIQLPPLRDRLSDVEELAVAFTARFRPGAVISKEALFTLTQYDWPGNVRELRNAIERATILMEDGDTIKAEHIIL